MQYSLSTYLEYGSNRLSQATPFEQSVRVVEADGSGNERCREYGNDADFLSKLQFGAQY